MISRVTVPRLAQYISSLLHHLCFNCYFKMCCFEWATINEGIVPETRKKNLSWSLLAFKKPNGKLIFFKITYLQLSSKSMDLRPLIPVSPPRDVPISTRLEQEPFLWRLTLQFQRKRSVYEWWQCHIGIVPVWDLNMRSERSRRLAMMVCRKTYPELVTSKAS